MVMMFSSLNVSFTLSIEGTQLWSKKTGIVISVAPPMEASSLHLDWYSSLVMDKFGTKESILIIKSESIGSIRESGASTARMDAAVVLILFPVVIAVKMSLSDACLALCRFLQNSGKMSLRKTLSLVFPLLWSAMWSLR